MIKLVPYIVKNIARSKTRTILTVFGVLIGVSIFTFLISVELSIAGKIDRVSEDTILVVQQKDQW